MQAVYSGLFRFDCSKKQGKGAFLALSSSASKKNDMLISTYVFYLLRNQILGVEKILLFFNVLFSLLQSEKDLTKFERVVCLLFDFVALPDVLERFHHKLYSSQIAELKKSYIQYEKKSLLDAVEGSVVVSQRLARKI